MLERALVIFLVLYLKQIAYLEYKIKYKYKVKVYSKLYSVLISRNSLSWRFSFQTTFVNLFCCKHCKTYQKKSLMGSSDLKNAICGLIDWYFIHTKKKWNNAWMHSYVHIYESSRDELYSYRCIIWFQ